MLLSSPPEATRLQSGEKATHHTRSMWPARNCIIPVATSHRTTLWSKLPETRDLLSGAQHILLRFPQSEQSDLAIFPVIVFHVMMISSSLPDAINFAFGDHATVDTVSLCPDRSNTMIQLTTSHTNHFPTTIRRRVTIGGTAHTTYWIQGIPCRFIFILKRNLCIFIFPCYDIFLSLGLRPRVDYTRLILLRSKLTQHHLAWKNICV
jgi:hypothetical protein